MFRRTLLVLCCMMIAPLGVSAQTIQSTFDAGLEGWTTSTGGSLTFSATGGNPGGYLQQMDLDLQDMFVMAPAPFLGNLSAFQGGTLSFDVKQIVGTADYAPFGIVILRNGANFVSADIVPPGLPGSDWSTQSVILNATSFGTTPDFLASIMSNVTALEIMLESQVGVFETVGLDNVQLAVAVPEPGSLFLLTATGVGAILTCRRKRLAQK
ncbi:MAG: PEP-CTERM sorting domain-containing protein [Planctomycetia bacterium]|nr:PEP-CTERM sorting domain-containing protein [Planctomycetia bacterium]